MNHFEMGIAGSEGFHAVMSTAVASKSSRMVQGEQRRFFYNPMWSYFGNRLVAGTYYDGSGEPLCFFWNMFDEVLIPPDLIPRFDPSGVEIVTTAGSTTLLSQSNRPDNKVASDHLPIAFRLN
jgi:hypothetical protein